MYLLTSDEEVSYFRLRFGATHVVTRARTRDQHQ